jgi:serine protease Do
VYGVACAVLLAGGALSAVTGLPAGAQIAQNDPQKMQATTQLNGTPASFAELVQQLQPAVVNISTRERVRVANQNPLAGTPFENLFGGQASGTQDGSPQTREAQSLGSGFIISADGYVVTNYHVITAENRGEVESITVTTAEGSEYPAKLVGHDAASDLAVLKISDHRPFQFVKFGDSRNARVGDRVLAIGNPFGLGGTVTRGIISAVYRNTGSGSAYDRYLQTDASINQGNSGGPMFDMRGQVIGINNAIFSPSGGSVGIGFAIPAEIAAPIVEHLKTGAKIERGYLGLAVEPVNDDLAESLGIPHNRGELVQEAEAGKGGAIAGVQAGDVIMKAAGKDVTPSQSLSYIVTNIAPGTRIPIELIRKGNRMTVTALVGTRPSEEQLAQDQTFGDKQGKGEGQLIRPPRPERPGLADQALGLSVIPLTPGIATQLGVPDTTTGLVISAVDASSDAGAKGFQRGDVILSANNRQVATVPELDAAIRTTKANHRVAILLQVLRRGQPATYVPVRLK